MRIRAGTDIYTLHRDPEQWYRVHEGHVQIRQIITVSREIALFLFGPGDLLPPLPPTGGPLAEALVPGVVEAIDERVSDEHLLREMLLVQSRLVVAQRQLVTDILARNHTIRLVRVLRDLAAAVGVADDDGMVRIGIPLTAERLGRMAGTNRVAISRAMGDLRDHGLIARRNRQIAVDPIALNNWLNI